MTDDTEPRTKAGRALLGVTYQLPSKHKGRGWAQLILATEDEANRTIRSFDGKPSEPAHSLPDELPFSVAPDERQAALHRLIERVLSQSRKRGVRFGDGPEDIDTGELASDIMDALPGHILAIKAEAARLERERLAERVRQMLDQNTRPSDVVARSLLSGLLALLYTDEGSGK